MGVSTTVVSYKKAFLAVENSKLNSAKKKIGDAILGRARMLAPVDTGALRSDGKIEISGDGLAVAFGSRDVPYARKRHYENRKNPQTLHYLERAGDSVVKEGFEKFV